MSAKKIGPEIASLSILSLVVPGISVTAPPPAITVGPPGTCPGGGGGGPAPLSFDAVTVTVTVGVPVLLESSPWCATCICWLSGVLEPVELDAVLVLLFVLSVNF